MGADFTLWRSFLRTKYALSPKQTLLGALESTSLLRCIHASRRVEMSHKKAPIRFCASLWRGIAVALNLVAN